MVYWLKFLHTFTLRILPYICNGNDHIIMLMQLDTQIAVMDGLCKSPSTIVPNNRGFLQCSCQTALHTHGNYVHHRVFYTCMVICCILYLLSSACFILVAPSTTHLSGSLHPKVHGLGRRYAYAQVGALRLDSSTLMYVSLSSSITTTTLYRRRL